MPKIDRRNVYQQAIERWGIDSQVNQLIEECAELIVALNHARRVSWDGAPADHVVEELADVEIMLEQMRMIFDADRIDQVKLQKVLRLRNRIAAACEG